jgi:hypothetical protein
MLLVLECVDLLPLTLAGVVGRETVALDTLDTTLFLLVGCLCTLARWQVGLGLRQDLAP